jgi:hypothetical protein
VALAGKIAGNARKSPPSTGPKYLARVLAITVIAPPNAKRTRYSYHFVLASAPMLKEAFICCYRRNSAQVPSATPSHTMRLPIVAGAASTFLRSISQVQRAEYIKRHAAPTTMDRASRAAYTFPSAKTVNPRVAKATDGAAPNRPAKLFGFSTSPRQANRETIVPPTRNRNKYCSKAGSYRGAHVI